MDLNLTLFSYKDDRLDLVVKCKQLPQIHWNSTKINGVERLWHPFWDKLVVSTTDEKADDKINEFYKKDILAERLPGTAFLEKYSEKYSEKWTLKNCRITNYEMIDEIRLIELMLDSVYYLRNYHE